MKSLVIVQHDNTNISTATLHCICAASEIDATELHVLVAGHDCASVAEQAATLSNVTQVIHADDASYANFLAENMATLITSIGKDYSHILAPSNTFGKNIMPRVAALLDVAQITDMMEVIDANTFKRPIYAGNAIATVESSDAIKIITVRTTQFDKAEIGGGNATVTTLDSTGDSGLSEFIKLEQSDATGPDLTSADIVISGGRGVGSAENFKLLEAVAEKFTNCAIGASRAAVDAGYVPNDMQVGQTGKIVAPQLYIAVGISGAIQHLAGMKDSKIIVAINKDENAPIFDVADYGLVADLFTALPELEQHLS